VKAGGSTALFDGVQLGARQVEPFAKDGYAARVILLSDGMANVGPSSARELASLGRALAERGATITTIGLGLDYDEDLMTALAAESGGNAYFVKTAAALPEIFAKDLEDAVALRARRVKVTLTCGGEVLPIRVVGRGGEKRGKQMEASIGNLYGSEKYALFEVELPARGSEGEKNSSLLAATVALEYIDAPTGLTVTRESPLTVTYTKDKDAAARSRNADIAVQTELAKNAEIQEEVVRLMDEGKQTEAVGALKQRAEYLKSPAAPMGMSAEPAVREDAARFEALADDLEKQGSLSNQQRKQSLNDAYIRKNQQSK
jgi:Ca-activated chloride channel family protein